jgi:hypothetical protein
MTCKHEAPGPDKAITDTMDIVADDEKRKNAS